jgi:hypothetical protein
MIIINKIPIMIIINKIPIMIIINRIPIMIIINRIPNLDPIIAAVPSANINIRPIYC